MPRGRKKGGKGGAKRYITDASQIAQRDKIEEVHKQRRRARRGEEGADAGSDSEGSDSEGPVFEVEAPQPEKVYKPKGAAAVLGDEIANLNAKTKTHLKVSDMKGDVKVELTRREREELEKQARHRAYMRKHAAGETDEAKKDLARLNAVKRRRAEAARRKKENDEAEAERESNKGKAVEDSDDSDVEIVKLESRAIKKMKPPQLKEELKKRGLDIQGNKKTLMARLTKYNKEH